ncbi:MAG TPA: RDD family protein [Clostridiaceae bacterium]
MYCKRCGGENPDEGKFCIKCGNALDQEINTNLDLDQNQNTGNPVNNRSYGYENIYAGFWLRFVAYMIDGFILAIPIGIIVVIFIIGLLAKVGTSYSTEYLGNEFIYNNIGIFIIAYILLIFILILIKWIYFAVMESSKNQGTLGKMALGIKVTDLNGERLSFGRASGRFFSKYISALTCTIGYIMAGFTEKKQALHDMISGALVVRK